MRSVVSLTAPPTAAPPCAGAEGFPDPTRPADPSRRRVRPCLEGLEDRITPTTFAPTVFTIGVTSGGQVNTLRDAITAANAEPGTAPDTIQLVAGTYTLSIANSAGKHEQADASGDLNIINTSYALVFQGTTDASGHPTTTIDQKALDRVFQIVNASNVTFQNLVIEGGQVKKMAGSGRRSAAPRPTAVAFWTTAAPSRSAMWWCRVIPPTPVPASPRVAASTWRLEGR